MDHHRHEHNHCRGYLRDRDDDDIDENQQCRRYSHRFGRQHVDDPRVARTATNRNDSIEYNGRTTSSERRPTEDHGTVGSRGQHNGDDSSPRPSRPNRMLLVHGLDRVPVNCDRVFNLFCLYGNVAVVKVLRGDKALVEMEDGPAAERCVSNLHLMPLDDAGEWRLKVKYSKHSFIHDQVVFNKLSDDTPVQKDYSDSRLNRFSETSSRLDRCRITNPSKILHFFNAPIDVCGFAVHKAVTDALGVADAIRSITILPIRLAAKCSTGLIELKTVALAAKTVLLSNHMPLESKRSRFPFITKLCFSKWSEIRQVTEPGADVSLLRLSCELHSPQLHESERRAATSTFQLVRTTAATGCCGDCPWTLWTVKLHETPAAVFEPSPTTPPPPPPDVQSELFDMLRHRLCSRDDQGDVLHGDPPAASDEATAARRSTDAAVQVSGGCSLGDA